MKTKKYIGLTGLMIILMVCLTAFAGCSSEKKNLINVEETLSIEDKDPAEYEIYYKSSDGLGLKTVNYHLTGNPDDILAVVTELFEQLSTQIPDNPLIVPAVEKGRKIATMLVLSDGTLKIDFIGAPNETNTTDIILARAAFVLTMTQIKGIDYVDMSYDGVPVNVSSSSTSNKMSANDFILQEDESVNSKRKSTLTLYFANKEGSSLCEVEKSILYSGSAQAERMVMQLLIDGPGDDKYRAVLPADLSIIDISVKSGVCYLNLGNEFLTNTDDLPAELIIYSIVNSLTALPTVGQVQISVNGKSDILFREAISLNESFTTNLNYIHR